MAGTDTAHSALEAGPAIILVAPQLGENIGAAARAMLNCGLSDLRLVRPREGWPSPRAYAMASGADVVLDSVQIFDTGPIRKQLGMVPELSQQRFKP